MSECRHPERQRTAFTMAVQTCGACGARRVAREDARGRFLAWGRWTRKQSALRPKTDETTEGD